MLKILIIAEAKHKLPTLAEGKVVATVNPGAAALEALRSHKPDLVISSTETAIMLNSLVRKTTAAPRDNISASTHQGIQLVPVADILYFQAEHKYVTAHHGQGELLIEDSMASLEQEFVDSFVRVHRKTLVAIAKIEQVLRSVDGQHYIKLRNSRVELIISRRQLPKVRKILLCK